MQFETKIIRIDPYLINNLSLVLFFRINRIYPLIIKTKEFTQKREYFLSISSVEQF